MFERTEFEEYLIEKCKGFEDELKVTREEVFELQANLIFYRQFYNWAKNRLEEEGILLTENGVKKPSEMTKAELIARNELVIRKQENRISDKPGDLPPIPTYDELLEKYEENKPNGVIVSVFNYSGVGSERFVHQGVIINLKQEYITKQLEKLKEKQNFTESEVRKLVSEIEAVYGTNPIVMKAATELLAKTKESTSQV